MIVATCGKSAVDDRPQMIIGLNPADLVRLLTEGTINLNDDEPDNHPLPCHVMLMMGESNQALEDRLHKAEKSALAREDDEDG